MSHSTSGLRTCLEPLQVGTRGPLDIGSTSAAFVSADRAREPQGGARALR